MIGEREMSERQTFVIILTNKRDSSTNKQTKNFTLSADFRIIILPSRWQRIKLPVWVTLSTCSLSYRADRLTRAELKNARARGGRSTILVFNRNSLALF